MKSKNILMTVGASIVLTVGFITPASSNDEKEFIGQATVEFMNSVEDTEMAACEAAQVALNRQAQEAISAGYRVSHVYDRKISGEEGF